MMPLQQFFRRNLDEFDISELHLESIKNKIKSYELMNKKEADKYRILITIELAKASLRKGRYDKRTFTTLRWIVEELPKVLNDRLYEYEGNGSSKEEGMDKGLEETLLSEIPKIGIKDIKGRMYREIVQELKEFVMITKTELGQRPEAEREAKILLHGPPGTGKTYIAQAIANELNIPALYLITSLIWQRYVGDSEKRLMSIFQRAVELNGMIIIDEFDALVQKRGKDADRVVLSVIGLLLQLLIREKPVVLAITNLPWLLDEAILDRFDKIVYIPPPDDDARRAIFRYYLFEKYDVAGFPESDLHYLVDLTKPKEIKGRLYYYTARNIWYIVREASFMARRHGNGKITLHQLRIATKKVRLQVSEDLLKKYEEFDKNIF